MEETDHAPVTTAKKVGKQHNNLPLWGNEATMNLNPLILANIQGSSYFKVQLFKLKTYHEVVDEIYYQVKHMEPWERGSRKTAGQTGMCGGVRGVGAGGIVSTAFCLLYKLYTLRLTRKQVNGLLNHTDSPYIRALGFMYLRFTQPPADLYDWYEDYLQDDEEIDVKAGGGQILTVGQMVYQFLTKLDWFSTLFPRIPVPIQKQIERKLNDYCRNNQISLHQLCTGRAGDAGGVAADEMPAQDNRREREREPPRDSNYYGEHDDRDAYYGRSSRRERSRSRSPYAARRDRHRYKQEDERIYEQHYADDKHDDVDRHHREKHKKKRKHKHHSHSRSRSRSQQQQQPQSQSFASSKRDRDRDYERERERNRSKRHADKYDKYEERRHR